MSETPRTDALLDQFDPSQVLSALARRLREQERELAAAKARVAELENSIQTGLEVAAKSRGLRAEGCVQCAQLSVERDALCADAERLDWIEENWFYKAYDDQIISFRFNEMWDAGQHADLRAAIDAASAEGGKNV